MHLHAGSSKTDLEMKDKRLRGCRKLLLDLIIQTDIVSQL